ncbi:hypothetical protein M271_38680 [Streptomyces rapamycinicus NRRL 5491]|nr:hypothetical protein M271_38680 [Streptomyces rapamycinicus NRRL 5491]
MPSGPLLLPQPTLVATLQPCCSRICLAKVSKFRISHPHFMVRRMLMYGLRGLVL